MYIVITDGIPKVFSGENAKAESIQYYELHKDAHYTVVRARVTEVNK